MRRPSRFRLVQAIGLLIPAENPARHVDGVLLTGALLAVESTRHETLGEVAGSVTTVLVLLWMSHSYAETLGERLELGHPLSLTRIWRAAAHELALLRGAFFPLVVLLIADAFGLSADDAVIAALLSAVVLLFTIEVVAAVRADLAPKELAIQVAVGGLLGVGVLSLHLIH